jgi:hypothetical protein
MRPLTLDPLPVESVLFSCRGGTMGVVVTSVLAGTFALGGGVVG